MVPMVLGGANGLRPSSMAISPSRFFEQLAHGASEALGAWHELQGHLSPEPVALAVLLGAGEVAHPLSKHMKPAVRV